MPHDDMNQPPGPEEAPDWQRRPPAGAPDFLPPDFLPPDSAPPAGAPETPALRPATPGDHPFGPQPAVIPPPATPPPALRPPAAQYDPRQTYVVYQAAGLSGFTAPGGNDPLISPDYGGWWRRSTAVFRRAWPLLLPLQLAQFVLGLVVTIPGALYSNKFLTDFSNTSFSNTSYSGRAQADPSSALAVLGASLLVSAALAVLGAVIAVAANHVIVAAAAGLPPRLGPALALAVRRCLPLMGWQILAALMLALGLCACILPGIYFYAVLMVLPVVVTFERGGAGIGRCFRLFHNDVGVAASRVATIGAAAVVLAIVSAVVGVVIAAVDLSQTGGPAPGQVATLSTTAVIVQTVVRDLLGALLRTFTCVLVLTAYADMRARTEPLSTSVLAAEIGITPAAPSAPFTPPAPSLA
ncbi:proline-rich domain-containing protein [Dactylosporangium darangshiense]|uniref:proline-rich domain-containing protein n=1 Tax=Dactylosporangium darangshiense TaxID=579108 RepID=UPI0031E7AC8A